MPKLVTLLLGLVGLGCLGIFGTASVMVDETKAREQIIHAVEQVTGRKVSINGKVEVSLFPTPTLTLTSVFLSNAPEGYAEYFIGAKRLEAVAGVRTLFTGDFSGASLTLIEPDVHLERLADGSKNWEFTAAASTPAEREAPPTFNETPSLQRLGSVVGALTLQNGKLKYTTSRQDAGQEMRNVNGTMVIGGNGLESVVAEVSWRAMPVKLALNFGAQDSNGQPVEGSITLHNSTLSAQGVMRWGALSFQGTASLASDGLEKLVEKVFHPGCTIAVSSPLTVQGQSEISWANNVLSINRFTVQSPLLSGVLTAAVEVGEKYKVESNVQIENASLDDAAALFHPVCPQAETVTSNTKENPFALLFNPPGEQVAQQSLQNVHLANFVKDFTGKVTLSAKAMTYRGETISNLEVGMHSENGTMGINPFGAVLPGATRFTAYGVLDYDVKGRATIEGAMDVGGTQLRTLLQWLGVTPQTTHAEALGAFRLKTNFSVDAEELRFSEARGLLDSTGAAGSVVLKWGRPALLETRLRLDKLALDDYLPPQKAAATLNPNEAATKAAEKERPFVWLDQVRMQWNGVLSIDALDYQQRHFRDLYLQLHVAPSQLTLKDMKVAEGEDLLSGSFEVSVINKKPQFKAKLNFSELDTAMFLRPAPEAAALPLGMWDQQEYRYELASQIDGEFDISSRVFIHQGLRLENVTCTGSLKTSRITVDNLRAMFHGGQLQLRGLFSATSIPGFSVSFSLSGANAIPLLQQYMGVQVNAGTISGSGALKTSGINQASWMSNLEGSLLVEANNLAYPGVDISALGRRLTAIRSVADVVNVADQAFSGGETFFSLISGNFVVDRGVATTSGITARTDGVEGAVNGRVDITNWRVEMLGSMKLNLPGTTEMPAVLVGLQGPLHKPERKVDTTEVEKFIARRMSDKAMDR